MNIYLVTIRLPKNPAHDPRNKVTGACPANNGLCTDVTGEHHTYMMMASTIDEVRTAAEKRLSPGAHITRIELG